MAFPFYSLPDNQAPASRNMARDLLLLERFPESAAVRFRHYGWELPAFTFGYAQAWEFVVAQTVPVATPGQTHPPERIRRPSGGGVVDHRNDWTYALVIPQEHPRCRGNAAETYRLVHEALARAISALGVQAKPFPCPKNQCVGTAAPRQPVRGPGLCFAGPEVYDVVRAGTSVKLAGAAQKRNRHGLLLQGSVDRAVTGAIEWESLKDCFLAQLADVLELDQPKEVTVEHVGAEDEWTERFASEAWNQRR